VVVEIESEPTAGSWARETSLSGYTGSAYYTGGQWTWHTRHEDGATHSDPAYTLTAGIHTLEISGRSKNYSIDRFHLYLGTVANPLDTSRPQSSTGAGGTPPPAPTPSPAPGGQAVTSVTLVNADTDQPVAGFDPLQGGATLNLGTLPSRNLNVRANTNPATVGSVVFGYDGNGAYRTESTAPYALAGDTSGNYNAWTPTVGSHTVTATPYDAAGGAGSAGASLTVTFTVIDDPSTPSSNGSGGSAGGGGTGGSAGGTGGSPSDNGDRSINDSLCGLVGLEGALLALFLLAGRRRYFGAFGKSRR
jgi:hypothetical protein